MNVLKTLFVFLAIINYSTFSAQQEYRIKKSTNKVQIDGDLKEEQWINAEALGKFIVRWPVFGELSKYKTVVKMYYDNTAVYIGAEIHYQNVDSISYIMSQRDDPGNADWFGVTIDPYANNISAFSFGVTSTGVEIDALASLNDMDDSWNAVWRSSVKRQSFGWSVEIKIPYSALRFPNKKIQNWNINFSRQVRAVRETSDWSPINPEIFGEITQSGKLIGIENIEPPVRLSFTPYATGYLENSFDEASQKQTWKNRLTGGLDLKLGLNDAFTLDMTVVPDFGQTRSDNQILNLSPFEVRFSENRPFFLEGTDLFSIGNIFYSRRIGGSPFNQSNVYDDLDESIGESVVSNPSVSQLLNATKISGRTKSGLGIGVFNAVEGRSEAIIENSLGNRRTFVTNPLTNKNIFVLSQNLKNNSTISLVNTNVIREGSNRDANVTAGVANLYTSGGSYRMRTNIALSTVLDDQETNFGHRASVNFDKVAGKWQYGVSYSEESETYDPNDLGFIRNNNSRGYGASLEWNDYNGSKRFFRRNAEISWFYNELYRPQKFSFTDFSCRLGGLHKKQIYMQLFAQVSPFGSVDHFESRQFGKPVKFNPNARMSYFFTSDYSKRFALDGRLSYTPFFGTDQYRSSFVLSPRVRVSDRMNFVLRSTIDFNIRGFGYISGQDLTYSDEIVLGVRDRIDIENTITSEFIFTKRMGIDLQIRHYWAQVEYQSFLALEDEGETREINYSALNDEGKSVHNTIFNAFTIDINYRWVFSPGSELRIVYKNNIFSSQSIEETNYFGAFNTLFNQPQINSISMKFLFYIDALYFKRKDKNNQQG